MMTSQVGPLCQTTMLTNGQTPDLHPSRDGPTCSAMALCRNLGPFTQAATSPPPETGSWLTLSIRIRPCLARNTTYATTSDCSGPFHVSAGLPDRCVRSPIGWRRIHRDLRPWRNSASTARPLPSRARSDPEQSASEWQARIWQPLQLLRLYRTVDLTSHQSTSLFEKLAADDGGV